MTGYQYFTNGLGKWHKLFFLVLFSLIIFTSFDVGDAIAQQPQVMPDCSEELDANGNKTGVERTGFTAKVVGCVEDILFYQVQDTEFQRVRDEIVNIVFSLIVLYIIMFGYRVTLGGVRKPMSETMLHLFKISFVMFFAMNAGVDIFFPFFKQTLQELTVAVSDFSLISGNSCNDISTYDTVWQRVDCVLASFLAAEWHFDDPASVNMAEDPYENDAPTLYAMPSMFLGLLTAPIGWVVVIIMAVTFFILIIGFAAAVVYYLMCVVAVIILSIVAPIFIPTILFKTTRGFFDRWFQALVAYTIQPAILFAYLAFMTHALSLIMYGDPNNPNSDIGINKMVKQIKEEKIDNLDEAAWKSLFRVTQTTRENTPLPTGEFRGRGENTASSTKEVPTITTSDDENAKFLVNLIVVGMVAGLLNAFMFSVMQFGGMIAGIPMTFSMSQFTNMFSSTIGMTKRALKI